MGYSLYRAYECAVIKRICCYGKTQQACRAFCVASLVSLHSECSDSLAACGIATCYLAQNPRTLQVSTEKLAGLISPLHLQGTLDLTILHYSLLKQKDQRKVSWAARGWKCDLSLLLPNTCCLPQIYIYTHTHTLATSTLGGEIGLLHHVFTPSHATVTKGPVWLSLCQGKGVVAWTPHRAMPR